eukprot:462587-Prymnesium_polylepis.1
MARSPGWPSLRGRVRRQQRLTLQSGSSGSTVCTFCAVRCRASVSTAGTVRWCRATLWARGCATRRTCKALGGQPRRVAAFEVGARPWPQASGSKGSSRNSTCPRVPAMLNP